MLCEGKVAIESIFLMEKDGEFEAEILNVNRKNIQIIPKKLIRKSESLPDIFLCKQQLKD
jgi:hypothetical protein